jgi:cell division protein FtsL
MSLALEWKERGYTARERPERRARDDEEMRRRKCARESRRMRLTFMCFVGVAAFVSALLILIVCLHVMVVQNEMKANEVEKEIELERRKHEAMRLEIASLESPARIESVAVEQLGMVRMAQAEYLETPSYKTAMETRQREDDANGEGMVTEATQGVP